MFHSWTLRRSQWGSEGQHVWCGSYSWTLAPKKQGDCWRQWPLWTPLVPRTAAGTHCSEQHGWSQRSQTLYSLLATDKPSGTPVISSPQGSSFLSLLYQHPQSSGGLLDSVGWLITTVSSSRRFHPWGSQMARWLVIFSLKNARLRHPRPYSAENLFSTNPQRRLFTAISFYFSCYQSFPSLTV